MKLVLPLLAILAAVGNVTALGSSCSTPLGSGSAASDARYWMETITRQGSAPFNPSSSYKIFRDVTKSPYNAAGNGVTDDTDAINRAISDMGRCGNLTCQSSSVEPALIYFPPGNYLITKPIVPYYYTSLVGDPKNKPHIIARGDFVGIGLIDADPYSTTGAFPTGGWNCPSADPQWYCPVNNFFRSVRNFVIDTRNIPAGNFGTGMHWQVGQATSLINIDFMLSTAAGNKHQAIFMENGSGGFMADLTINGGAFGLWISNQQFTVHNVQITNADTAIFNQWNWGFTYKNIRISNCRIGFGLNTNGQTEATQSAGSITVLDSWISASEAAIQTNTDQSSKLGGAIFLQNVNLDGSGAGVMDGAGHVFLAGGGTVNQFVLGNQYSGTSTSHTYNTKATPGPDLPAEILDGSSSNNGVFFRTRPQYNNYAVSEFASAKANGVVCDGKTDATGSLQAFIDKFWGCKILYLDAGVCKVSNTIKIPTGSIVVGEFWTTILASGSAFNSASKPTPVLQVGNPGDQGTMEMSDIVVSTVGGSAGAIAIEWNVNGDKGKVGAWDVHIRIGGAIGTNLQRSQCPTTSTATSCMGAFLGLHILGGGYFENVWTWTADHDLDDPAQGRINVFTARGVFIDHSPGPVWLVGTASEHSVFYQYSVVASKNVYMGLIQTETPYYQPTPAPPAPFSANSDWDDPSWASSGSAWGLNIASSSSVYVYGAGLYSFFISYSEACKPSVNCQKGMVLVDADSRATFINSLGTIGATTMLTVGSTNVASHSDNVDGLQSTLSRWTSAITSPAPPPPVRNPCTQVQGWVEDWATYMVEHHAQSFGTLGVDFTDIPEAWEAPVGWEALTNYVWATGDANVGTYLADSVYIMSGRGASLPEPTAAEFGGGNDDVLWAALGWLKYWQFEDAHGITGKNQDFLLKSAKMFIDVVASSIPEDPCPGGVWWVPDTPSKGKNTITAALFIHASTMYYSITKTASYLTNAQTVYNWIQKSGANNSDGIYFDGPQSPNCGFTKDLYTYNTGEMLAAMGALYAATGDKDYLNAGNATLHALTTSADFNVNGTLFEHTCDADECTGGNKNDNAWAFKGIAMRSVQYFLDAANDPAITSLYSPWIAFQATSINANAKNTDNDDIGNVWTRRGAQVFGASPMGMAVNAANAAVKYGANDGTFVC